MGMVMDISDHVVVLNFGQVIARGTPAEVQADPEVDPRLPRARATSAQLRARSAAKRAAEAA